MTAARRATRVRPSTPDEHLDGGGVRVHVQRCCTGCRGVLGNATDAELVAAIMGEQMPSTTTEHGCAHVDSTWVTVIRP